MAEITEILFNVSEIIGSIAIFWQSGLFVKDRYRHWKRAFRFKARYRFFKNRTRSLILDTNAAFSRPFKV